MTVKWTKKSALMIIVMVLSLSVLLAACSSNEESGNNEGGSNTENTTGSNASTANKDQAESGEPKPKEKPMISSSIYDRGNVPKEEGTIEENRWTKWINENGPAQVEFTAIPRWESIQKYNTLFAAGDAPDLIFEYSTVFRDQLYEQKQLLPLDDLMQHMPNYQKLIDQYPVLEKVGSKSDGKLYELGRVNTLAPNHVLLIRKDWLDQLGLAVPKTTEDFFNVAKAFTEEDPDGNGQDDTLGMALSFVNGMVVDFMFGSVFTIYDKAPWYVKDGELVRDWERMQAATAFKKRMYEAGVVDPDYLTDSRGEKAKQDWVSGKLGMYGANSGYNDFNTFKALKENNPDAKVIAIPLPESPFGQFSPVIHNPVQMVVAVNAKAEHPKAVAEYLNFLLSEDTMTRLSYGIEGRHYTLNDQGCPVPVTDEAIRKEIDYTGDFRMLFSSLPDDPCNSVERTLNPPGDDPLREEFAETVSQTAYHAYINPDRPMPAFTHSELMPVLPQQLELRKSNAFKTIQDQLAKSVVSGSAYSPEQAIEDSKQAWNQAGGEEIDQWMSDWYEENKDNVLLTEDMYQFAK